MKQSIVRLAENGVLSERRGIRSVACVSGTLWLTGRGTGDVLLRAGESLDTAGMRDLCVQALGDSTARLDRGIAQPFPERKTASPMPALS